MLTHRTDRTRQAVVAPLVSLLLAVTALVALGSTPAAADPPTCTGDNGETYTCTIPGTPGTPGTPGDGDGGSSTPSCELSGTYTFCSGTSPCRMIPWQIPYRLPEGPKPNPDSEPLIRACLDGGTETLTIYWSDDAEPQPPSLAEQAQTAIGQLDLALPALRTSPDGRTVVNFPTWYWLDGAPGQQVGTSAFGLRAVATVGGISIDPGDGSGTLTCPVTTSAEAAQRSCTHTYASASDGGSASWEGRPAHTVSASSTWDLSFTYNGVPVANIPGAPDTLQGPASTAVLRVDEVQTVVVGTD